MGDDVAWYGGGVNIYKKARVEARRASHVVPRLKP